MRIGRTDRSPVRKYRLRWAVKWAYPGDIVAHEQGPVSQCDRTIDERLQAAVP